MDDLQRAHNDWLDPDSPRKGRAAEYRDEWREDMRLERMDEMATSYMIEGEWSGYRTQQRHIVHREFTCSNKFVEAVRKIGHCIIFTDGTALNISILEGQRPCKALSPIDGYTSLIRQCIAAGTNKVSMLVDEKAKP